MQRRTFLSRLAMLALAIVTIALSLGAATASAQPIVACGGPYRVDLTGLPNPLCYPLAITTSWGGGAVTWPPVGFPGYPGPGIFVEPVPAPPGMPLDFINVAGTILPPFPQQVNVPSPCGPLCVIICRDAAGCLYIKVYKGPCVFPPLPCP